MFSLWVTLQIRPECRQEFLTAIEINAQASVRGEESCHRFEVIELGTPGSNRFAFYELYRNEAAFEVQHKQAPHYFTYQETAGRVVVPGSQFNTTGTLVHRATAID